MSRPIDPDLDGFPDTRMATPNELRKMLYDAIRRGAEEKTENRALRKAANDPWRTDDPPKDGTVIVAIGNITEEWDGEIDVKPFTDSIYWIGGIGWVCQDGMSLVQFRDGDCRVTIHHWLPDPESPVKGRKHPDEYELERQADVERALVVARVKDDPIPGPPDPPKGKLPRQWG